MPPDNDTAGSEPPQTGVPGQTERPRRNGILSALLAPVRDFAAGVRAHATAYLRARAELLGIECGEAVSALQRLAVWGGLALLLGITGYGLCLVAALMAVAGEWQASRFGLLALIVGLGHLLFGAAVAWWILRRVRTLVFFQESRRQLKRDKEWLATLHPNHATPESRPENRS